MNSSDPRFDPIHQHFRPVGLETVHELESKLNARLPMEYIAFLSRYGGCGFSGDANVISADRRLPIFTFFDDKKLLSRLDIYSDLTAESKITFADDIFGNPFVLDTATGKIYFLNFSVNPPVASKVADSFNTFLASIEVQPFE